MVSMCHVWPGLISQCGSTDTFIRRLVPFVNRQILQLGAWPKWPNSLCISKLRSLSLPRLRPNFTPASSQSSLCCPRIVCTTSGDSSILPVYAQVCSILKY